MNTPRLALPKGKAKPAPKPRPPKVTPTREDGLAWVRKGAAIRQGLEGRGPAGKSMLGVSWDETGQGALAPIGVPRKASLNARRILGR